MDLELGAIRWAVTVEGRGADVDGVRVSINGVDATALVDAVKEAARDPDRESIRAVLEAGMDVLLPTEEGAAARGVERLRSLLERLPGEERAGRRRERLARRGSHPPPGGAGAASEDSTEGNPPSPVGAEAPRATEGKGGLDEVVPYE